MVGQDEDFLGALAEEQGAVGQSKTPDAPAHRNLAGWWPSHRD
jgi:hypothetical protein